MHGTARQIFMVIFLLSLCACEKPNAQPELTDPTFISTGALKAETDKKIEEEQKKIEEMKTQIKEANPQSGLLKTSRLHYFASINQLESLRQLRKYYEVRQKIRALEVQQDSLTRFYDHSAREIAADDFAQDEKNRYFNRNWQASARRGVLLPKKEKKKEESKKE